jgi:hypothetical protein
VKFLCLDCDQVMAFAERQLPGDGTLAAVFACPGCGREMAMLTNPMETQLVSSMGVKIGGREVPEQPMETVRGSLEGARDDAFVEAAAPASDNRVRWTPEALQRLERVPNFVRGMVKRIYTDYAKERALREVSVEVMDRARSDLGLEGM